MAPAGICCAAGLSSLLQWGWEQEQLLCHWGICGEHRRSRRGGPGLPFGPHQKLFLCFALGSVAVLLFWVGISFPVVFHPLTFPCKPSAGLRFVPLSLSSRPVQRPAPATFRLGDRQQKPPRVPWGGLQRHLLLAGKGKATAWHPHPGALWLPPHLGEERSKVLGGDNCP